MRDADTVTDIILSVICKMKLASSGMTTAPWNNVNTWQNQFSSCSSYKLLESQNRGLGSILLMDKFCGASPFYDASYVHNSTFHLGNLMTLPRGGYEWPSHPTETAIKFWVCI
jgi:hypothetical protein